MFQVAPLSNERLLVHDLLRRTQRDHAPITGIFEYDLTDTQARLQALRREGRPVSLVAYTVRAASLMLKAHPELNRRLFRRWYGPREVTWDEVSCNLVVSRRGPEGERLGALKPAPQLFRQVCQALEVSPAALLHIGDRPGCDEAGALAAGCQGLILGERLPRIEDLIAALQHPAP